MLRKLGSIFVLLLSAAFTANLVNLITHRHTYVSVDLDIPIATKQKINCRNNSTHSHLHSTKLNTAFITGAIGIYGEEPKIAKCFAMMESLIRIGGWNGKVYLMTDANSDILSKIAELLTDNIVIIPVKTEWNDTSAEFGYKERAAGYLKTIIFDSAEITEDILIWHDCDKIITQTNCISDMFENNTNFFTNWNDQIDTTNIYMGRNTQSGTCLKAGTHFTQYKRCADGIYSGTFMAHRTLSKDILNKWQLRVLSKPSAYDRYKFYNAWKMDLPSTKVGQVPSEFVEMGYNNNTDTNCIVHVTNGIWKEGENKKYLIDVVKSLCLQSVSVDLLVSAYDKDEYVANTGEYTYDLADYPYSYAYSEYSQDYTDE